VIALEHVRLDPGILLDMLPHVQEDVETMAATLQLDIIPARAYRLIADKIAQNLAVPAA
jgi:hypothetical protein